MNENIKNRANQKLRNLFHSLLIIGGMITVLDISAELVFGSIGWWLILAILISILIGVRISPVLVMRLYRAQPLSYRQTPILYKTLHVISERAGLNVHPSLFYIPSSIPAAFTTGTQRNACIAVSDGLLRQLNLKEISGVLAHEISHIRHNDIWLMSLADSISRMASILSTFGLIIIFSIAPFLLFNEQGLPWMGIVLLAAIPSLTTLLQFGLSRTREFDADLGAIELTHDTDALISALTKIEAPQTSWFTKLFLPQRHDPSPSLLRTHPPLEERIKRLREISVSGSEHHPPKAQHLPNEFVMVTRKPRRHWSGVWY